MERRKASSLIVRFVSCLAISAAAVALTTTAASGAPTKAKAHQPAAKTAHSNVTHSNATHSNDHSAGNASTVGDASQPQPLSGADENAGGANGQCPGGPYCSTRDGSPSGNGNGNGNAVGKPCAGCVGKADNKNPQGQMPNGSDHNAGYECDTNHGIGRTNPAHTGCTSTTPPTCTPKPGEDENCQPGQQCTPKPGEDENCQPGQQCTPKPGE